LKLGQVVECDANFNEIWRYEIPTPWPRCGLRNGNTLIVDEHDRLVREVSPDKKVVWNSPRLIFRPTSNSATSRLRAARQRQTP